VVKNTVNIIFLTIFLYNEQNININMKQYN